MNFTVGNPQPPTPEFLTPLGHLNRCLSCFRLDGYGPCFDVDTIHVGSRLKAALTKFKFHLPDYCRTNVAGELGATATDDAGSTKASELVAAFCEAHCVTAIDLKPLTAASLLLHIDAVWPLLKKNSELTEASEESLCDLQLRCIDGLANSFISIEASADGPLCVQSSLFLRKLIEKSQEKVQARARAGQFHHGNARQR
jgi:hypothetical protein